MTCWEKRNTIKQNIDALEIKTGTINEVAKNSGMKFDGFNLSDVFEYMDEDLFREISLQLLECANNGAKFCYWNMMWIEEFPRFYLKILNIKKNYLRNFI